MSNAWDEMKKAKEDSYFERKNAEAIKRLAEKQSQKRLSPITGQPMEQVNLHGVVVDRCPTSGGIWLDAGELEQIIEMSKAESEGWLSRFVSSLKI